MTIFNDSFLKPPRANELEITCFGPGYGECIVVHIPGAGWGVIDSCVHEVGKSVKSLPLDYLLGILKEPYPKLAFVILTHPHEDHYRGMDVLIREYPGGVERVCRYGGEGVRELKTYINQRKLAYQSVLPGLIDVFKAMSESKTRGSQLRRLNEMSLILDLKEANVEGYGKTDIKLLALSPSSQAVTKYVEILFNAYPEVGKPVHALRDDLHNLISVALLLQIGEIQIVFGSDLENYPDNSLGWSAVVLNCDIPDLRADLVKVSHHGSETGFNREAWKRHCGLKKPVSIITPFINGNKIIPTSEDAKRFKVMSSKVGLTSLTKLSNNASKYYKRNVVQSINNKARCWSIVEHDKDVGFVRVRYHLNGRLTESTAVQPSKFI